MNSIIKRTSLILLLPLLMTGCLIQNPTPEDCVTKEITVNEIVESTSYDIMFKESNGDFYYINRGLERGLSIDELNETVLNKKVTLHLYKFWFGTSEHISQISLDDDIIFTEFN